MSNSRLRIVMPGGSGQVGTVLARYFRSRGHAVCVMARHAQQRPWRTVIWDGRTMGPWIHELEGADVVINLAGRSVNCRYNAANRREIMASRTIPTTLVGDAIAQCKHPPRLWLNASTATIYRHARDRPMDELTGELGGNEPGIPNTWKFSIDVAIAWERLFFRAQTPMTRKVALRSALILNPDRGSIFDTLLRLVRFGAGGAAAGGQQYVSWVHEHDFARAVDFIIQHQELSGAANIASPHPLPQREFMRILREAWGARIGLPATRLMLEIAAFFMRTETELILKSRWSIPTRLQNAGFQFEFPYWTAAAENLVERYRRCFAEPGLLQVERDSVQAERSMN